MKKLGLVLFSVFVFSSNCEGQNDFSYYNKEKIFIEWRESILDEVDSFIPLYTNDLHNFFVSVCQIRFSAFSKMIDTLEKYDHGVMPQYYIVYDCNVREGVGNQLVFRTYNNMGAGYEVSSYDRNKYNKIASATYIFDKKAFDQIYKRMLIEKKNIFHIFSISIFKSGHFETKIFSVNNPDDSKMLDNFLPYIGGW